MSAEDSREDDDKISCCSMLSAFANISQTTNGTANMLNELSNMDDMDTDFLPDKLTPPELTITEENIYVGYKRNKEYIKEAFYTEKITRQEAAICAREFYYVILNEYKKSTLFYIKFTQKKKYAKEKERRLKNILRTL